MYLLLVDVYCYPDQRYRLLLLLLLLLFLFFLSDHQSSTLHAVQDNAESAESTVAAVSICNLQNCALAAVHRRRRRRLFDHISLLIFLTLSSRSLAHSFTWTMSDLGGGGGGGGRTS
jgi:hypothetical protein